MTQDGHDMGSGDLPVEILPNGRPVSWKTSASVPPPGCFRHMRQIGTRFPAAGVSGRMSARLLIDPIDAGDVLRPLFRSYLNRLIVRASSRYGSGDSRKCKGRPSGRPLR